MWPSDDPHLPLSITTSLLHHAHGLNNMQNVLFRPIVCFSFFFSFIIICWFCYFRLMQHDSAMIPTYHYPPPSLCIMPMALNNTENVIWAFGMFFFIHCFFTDSATLGQHNTMQQWPAPTAISLPHALGLNNVQNPLFGMIVCFFFLFIQQ